MPIYNAKCTECGKVHEYSKRIAERDDTPTCCNLPTERFLEKAPMGFVDNPAFMSKYRKMY
jgi:hypothetical protein